MVCSHLLALAADDTADVIDISTLRVGFESHDRGQPSHEEHDGGSVEEGSGGVGCGLKVLCETTVAVDPGEEAFDDPVARLDGKSHLIGILCTISTAITVASATFWQRGRRR